MKMRTTLWMGMGGLMVLGFLGCSKGPKDESLVLATVAGEKITKAQFEEIVKVMIGDEKQAGDLLKGESNAAKEQRNQLLDSLTMQKSIIQLAKQEGLDKDTKTRFILEQNTAQLYLKTLVDRRLHKGGPEPEPTDADLKTIYDQGIAQRKAAGQTKDLPTFDQVKPQLVAGWKQNKQQERSETEFKALIAEMRQKYPATFTDGYKPTPQPGQP
jgi:hypothetical protein